METPGIHRGHLGVFTMKYRSSSLVALVFTIALLIGPAAWATGGAFEQSEPMPRNAFRLPPSSPNAGRIATLGLSRIRVPVTRNGVDTRESQRMVGRLDMVRLRARAAMAGARSAFGRA